jgi:transcriptional regulator GlxA family with amidase domain
MGSHRGHKSVVVAVVAFRDAQLLDIAGPLEVFECANRWLAEHRRRPPFYRMELLSEQRGPIATSGVLKIGGTGRIARVRHDIDTLLVAGGMGVERATKNRRLVRWIAASGRHARRVGSVCSGAFLLAEAGLLDGHRAATHWRLADLLQQRYPTLRVDRDALYVRDGSRITSAGITAGIDLALSLVEEDLDREVALGVARQLVVFRYRSGHQSQFSSHLAAQSTEREPLRVAQLWAIDNPSADLSVPLLAKRAGMSPRNFARVFAVATGTTPAKYVEDVRLDAAREMLATGRGGVDEVAVRSGFGTRETMRRRFVARLGVSPSVYRERFAGRRS